MSDQEIRGPVLASGAVAFSDTIPVERAMSLLLVTPPAAEPVSRDDAKLHLRVDHADEDTLIDTLIASARLYVELRLRRVLVTQAWRLFLDAWPSTGTVELPLRPLVAVNGVVVYDGEGTPATIPATDYLVDLVSDPPRIVLRANRPRPGLAVNGIEIDLAAGYGAPADVPAPIRTAILQLAAHWYERREPVAFGGQPTSVPETLDGLLDPYRSLSL